jgi:ATP adenylyltransferase
MYYICFMLKKFFEHKEYNTPVYETSNFVVIPTLGALVEGWLLIVPKVFYLNFSQIPVKQFDEVHQIIQHLEDRFRPLFDGTGSVVFEHGPVETHSTAGCGVDYAHLHWVPTAFNLKRGILEFLQLRYEWKLIDNLSEIKNNRLIDKDYLYLRDQSGNSFLTCQKEIPSQTFRKVIAHYINQPEQFDWKKNFGSENIKNVYSKLNMNRI